MEKRERYTDQAIQKYYHLLSMKQKNKVSFEYEIRVDSEKVIPRTNNLSVFYNYKELLTSQTENVEILIYKGLSRTYDKIIFEPLLIIAIQYPVNSVINFFDGNLTIDFYIRYSIRAMRQIEIKIHLIL